MSAQNVKRYMRNGQRSMSKEVKEVLIEKINCAICGKSVPIERSRLFWQSEGTYRTCNKGNMPHGKKK